MNPFSIFTDLWLNGNKLFGAKVDIPTEDADISNKEYVDKSVALDTDHATEYEEAFIDVGGIKVGDNVKDMKMKELWDAALFPRVLPEYKEAVLSSENITLPLNVIAGKALHVPSSFVITKNDRPGIIGNVSCVFQDGLGVKKTDYTSPAFDVKVPCQFNSCIVDPVGLSKFFIQGTFTGIPIKNDTYGDPYPVIVYNTQRTLSIELPYILNLPVFAGYNAVSEPDLISPTQISTVEELFSSLWSLRQYARKDAESLHVLPLDKTSSPHKLYFCVPVTPNQKADIRFNSISVTSTFNVRELSLAFPGIAPNNNVRYLLFWATTGTIAFDKDQSYEIGITTV